MGEDFRCVTGVSFYLILDFKTLHNLLDLGDAPDQVELILRKPKN